MPTIDFELLDAVFGGHVAAFGHRKEFKGCNYVPGEGGPDIPAVMIIGEAPGSSENIHKRPFVGPSRVLRQLMSVHAGLYAHYSDLTPPYTPEYSVNSWLTNVLKYRPPRNRTPTEEEIKIARPMLRLEWEAIGKPRIIVCVGKPALLAVTGKNQSILNAAGKCHLYLNRDGRDMAIWPMVHPAYVLRSKSEQLAELIEQDWARFGDWRKRHPEFHTP